MTQIEISKIEKEILKTQQFITDKTAFLISIPFGKITVNSTEVFFISNSALIKKQLVNSKASANF
jgi:hypothetical protein